MRRHCAAPAKEACALTPARTLNRTKLHWIAPDGGKHVCSMLRRPRFVALQINSGGAAAIRLPTKRIVNLGDLRCRPVLIYHVLAPDPPPVLLLPVNSGSWLTWAGISFSASQQRTTPKYRIGGLGGNSLRHGLRLRDRHSALAQASGGGIDFKAASSTAGGLPDHFLAGSTAREHRVVLP